MLSNIWNTLLYEPLTNALAILVTIVPWGDVGIAVVLLTILVKILLFPLSQRSIKSQAQMSILAPELNKIKKSGASKEEQARLTFELYKKHQTNPFSGCLLVLIQIPIIFALYYVFLRGVAFDPEFLYSFVHIPAEVNMNFLGLINISEKSFILALLAAVSQYFQAHFMPKPASIGATGGGFAESFSKSMHMQMKYILPVFIFFILYSDFLGISLNGVIALYFITSNLFAIGQQIYVKRKKGREEVLPPSEGNVLKVEAR